MKIIITQPVRHDGKDVPVGETLDLPNDQANALIDVGAAEPATAKKAAAEKATTEKAD